MVEPDALEQAGVGMIRQKTDYDIKFELFNPYWRMDADDDHPPSWTCNMGWHSECGGHTFFTDRDGRERRKLCPCPHHEG